MSPAEHVARRLRETRRMRGLSREMVCARLAERGIVMDHGTLAKIERVNAGPHRNTSVSRTYIGVDELYQLADVLAVDVIDLLPGDYPGFARARQFA